MTLTAQALAELMATELRHHPQFLDDETAHKVLEQKFAIPALARAQESGESHAWISKGECRAVVLRGFEVSEPFGFETEILDVNLCPNDNEALVWAQEKLLQLPPIGDQIRTLSLSGVHQALLPTLFQTGLGIDAVGLLGDTASSLAKLLEAKNPAQDFSAAGLNHVPMAVEHLNEVVALRRRTFLDQPEYCWFGAQESHLKKYHQNMEQELQEDNLWWVLLDENKVVGNFGSTVAANNQLWGPRGGLEIIIEPQYRGRGLAKTAYRLTLEGLHEKKLPVYKGATAQPAVMALSKIMGRQLQQIHLRSNAYFQRAHFKPFVPSHE